MSVAARRQWFVYLTAGAGLAVLAWTITSVGPDALLQQARGLGVVLPLVLLLAGARFALQAAGWRLAMESERRPRCSEAFAAVVAGEAAGYFAWGPISREPVKALLVGHRVPERAALAAAVLERLAYTLAALLLTCLGACILAVRFHRTGWLAIAMAAAVGTLVLASRFRRRRSLQNDGVRLAAGEDLTPRAPALTPREALSSVRAMWRERPRALMGIALLAGAQELTNVLEAYLVLAWLGSSPTLASVIVLEGISRVLNAAATLIPGKLGVSEGVTAALASSLHLGSAQGLSLALARRARSLLWGASGVALLTLHAATGGKARGVPALESLDRA